MIPLRAAHLAKRSDECRLCAKTKDSQPTVGAVPLRRILPLALTLAFSLVLIVISDGVGRAIGGGAAAGMLVGGLYLYTSRRSVRHAVHAVYARKLHAVAEDADDRVEAVIKQFEWAVNDLARVKSKLEQTEGVVRSLTERGREREHQNEQLVRQISLLRERLAEIAMAASLTASGREVAQPLFRAVSFTWSLHFDGVRTLLELQSPADDTGPTSVRVVGGDGQVVALSAVSVTSDDDVFEFRLEPPVDLVADLEAGRDSCYAVEALIDQAWRPVRLTDSGRRTRTTIDVTGKLSRVSAAFGASGAGPTRDGRRSALN